MKPVKLVKINFKEEKNRFSLTILLAVVVFLVLLAALGLAGLVVYLLVKFGLFAGNIDEMSLGSIVLLMCLCSLIIGGVIAVFFSKIPLRPVNKFINGLNSLAAGNYDTRIEYGAPIGDHPAFREITVSFNKLAEALENTEVLRSDFINNLSHEFKTPIVSIAGFAKLLKKENLTEEQRRIYLDAIEEESNRLSYMASNVLNMTKIANQTILTDVSVFNLSEQIRSCVLLLAGKWEKKDLELQLEFDEFDVEANEELLRHVWINLMDNAVKFTPPGGSVALDVVRGGGFLTVTVSNTGSEIPPDKIHRIFDKFYQGDESHATEGNGIGLAVVKSVVDLHGGNVSAQSKDAVTTFTVTLPEKQSLNRK